MMALLEWENLTEEHPWQWRDAQTRGEIQHNKDEQWNVIVERNLSNSQRFRLISGIKPWNVRLISRIENCCVMINKRRPASR